MVSHTGVCNLIEESKIIMLSTSWPVENDLKMKNGSDEILEAKVAERNERAKKLYR